MTKKTNIKQLISEKLIYIILIALIIAIVIIEPSFFSFDNLKNILAQSATKIIFAIGAAMVLMIKGVDLSIGRLIGLSALIAGCMLQRADYSFKMFPNLPELPLIVPILVVMVICGIVGAISGVTIAYFKVPAIIATLAMQLIIYGAASLFYDSGAYRAQPVGGLGNTVIRIGTGSIRLGPVQIPYIIIIAFAITALFWFIWNKTKFGKYMYAIGGNAEAARVSGVNVEKITVLIYVVAAALYAFASVLEIGRIGSATNMTGNGYEMDAIASSVIGGVSMAGGIGTIGGVVVGVLIFTVINYGLSFIGVNMYWQYIVKGLLILIAVIFDMRKYAKKK